MKYRLFLSDFDGTLVRADRSVSEKNKEAIGRYIAAGGIFAVCTGRALTSIMPRVKELGFTEGLVAAFQGAIIADIRDGKLLKNEGFTREEALSVARVMEEKNLHIHIYTAESFYCNKNDELLKYYEYVCGIKATLVEEEPLSARIGRENLCVIKTVIMVEPKDREEVYRYLNGLLGDRFYVTCSSEWLIEVMPKGQNKGEAVTYLSEYYGIPREEIAAIGDQWNDLPMLERAGGKFAVANAQEELRAVAQTVASNEDDGVAQALEIAMGE